MADGTSLVNIIANAISGKTRTNQIDAAVDAAQGGSSAGMQADKDKKAASDAAAANGDGRPAPSIRWSKLPTK